MTDAALVLCALLAGAALAWPGAAGRRAGLAGALVLTPVLLLTHVWDTEAFDGLRDRPAVLAVAAAAGVIAIAGGSILLGRRPVLLPLLAVAALPFRVPIALGGSTANLLIPLYLVVGAGVVALLLDARDRTGEDGVAVGWLERVLALLLVLYAVQATYSDDPDKALENVVFFYVPFALLFVLLARAVTWTRRLAVQCLGVLTGLALAFVAIGYVEYATKTLLLNPKVITSNQFESYFRVNSLFFDPNIYGRFLALTMLGLVAVLLWTRAKRTLAFAAGALAILWGGLVLTFSQSSFSALLLGLAVLAGLRWRPRYAVGAVAGLVAVALGVVLLAPGAIRLEVGDSDSLDSATSGRYELVRGGVDLAADKPLAGYGAGAFSRAFRAQEDASEQKATSASHTIPVTVAAEQGIGGLLVYIALLGVALARLGRGARDSVERCFVLAAFVALVLHTWLYAAFLEDPLTWALLGAGTGLLALTRAPQKTDEPAVALA